MMIGTIYDQSAIPDTEERITLERITELTMQYNKVVAVQVDNSIHLYHC